MHENYARDLDLNLLRTLVVVADAGSVTVAAARLYLTQPAVSAALRRLTTAVGAPLLVRAGRGVTLSAEGTRLVGAARPLLQALVDATLAPGSFDPATSTRVIRLGLSDSAERWLLPRLLRVLGRDAPRMTVIASAVQFRTIEEALASRRIDLALTVADELPPSIRRQLAFRDGFVCLFDPRHVRLPRRLTEAAYFACEHVIVSYNADLRGIVEDVVGKRRNVRCSLSGFAHIADVVDGTALLATVPMKVAEDARVMRPHLATRALPFPLTSGHGVELLWPAALDDDAACRWVREQILALTAR